MFVQIQHAYVNVVVKSLVLEIQTAEVKTINNNNVTFKSLPSLGVVTYCQHEVVL